MINMPMRSVGDAFHEAWRLRWPFLVSHLVFNLLAIAVLTPVTSLALRTAIGISGKPALSDFDIAYFLLSPAGFVAAILVASLLLTGYVLNVSFMMAIALHARRRGERVFEAGILRVLPRIPKIVGFAWRLLVRIVAIIAPFAVLALVVAQRLLSKYDINYYLSERPPEFLEAVVSIGAVLLVMTIVLLRYLLSWAVSLPLVLFDGASPADSFGRSSGIMRGQRLDLFLALLGWGAISTVIVAATFAAVGLVASGVTEAIGPNLERLALALLLLLAVWSLLNLLATSVTTGALAVQLMERAGWPGTAGADADPGRYRARLRLAVLAGGAGVAVATLAGGFDLSTYQPRDDVEIIAHRGAAGARPENTMASFEQAIEDRADWVELDVQESADGEVIVVHDSDFMKLAGVDMKVWDATAESLAQIDIGSWFAPEYADQRTPALRDVLELAKGTGSGVLIELKYYGHDQMLEQRVADVVEQTGMADSIQVMSLKLDGVKKMKALQPEWTVGLLAAASVGRLWELDADFLAVNMDMASHALVQSSRDAGKKVHVWTVNDPLAMSHMLSLGVSGLITDEPALARQIMAERSALSTAQRLVLALGSQLGLSVGDKVYRDGSP